MAEVDVTNTCNARIILEAFRREQRRVIIVVASASVVNHNHQVSTLCRTVNVSYRTFFNYADLRGEAIRTGHFQVAQVAGMTTEDAQCNLAHELVSPFFVHGFTQFRYAVHYHELYAWQIVLSCNLVSDVVHHTFLTEQLRQGVVVFFTVDFVETDGLAMFKEQDAIEPFVMVIARRTSHICSRTHFRVDAVNNTPTEVTQVCILLRHLLNQAGELRSSGDERHVSESFIESRDVFRHPTKSVGRIGIIHSSSSRATERRNWICSGTSSTSHNVVLIVNKLFSHFT